MCPLCAHPAQLRDNENAIDTLSVACMTCGKFSLPGLLFFTFFDFHNSESSEKALLRYLSGYTRQASERGEEIFLDVDNWNEFATAHANTSVATKLTRFLEIIAARSKPGKSGELDRTIDAPLLDAFDSDEVIFLAKTLHQRELIDYAGSDFYSLTAKGWEAIQSAGVNGIPGRCFVAMSFHDSLKDAYDNGIFLAVKNDCKMDPIRIDRVHHNEKICDKIVAEIRTCQFLIADVTLQRAGVYFEAGFAMGLGRQVIWTCRDDDLKNVHFDTRQYNHIVWKEPGDLRMQLADRIKATIPSTI